MKRASRLDKNELEIANDGMGVNLSSQSMSVCLFSITLMFRVFMELQPLHITKFWWSLSAWPRNRQVATIHRQLLTSNKLYMFLCLVWIDRLTCKSNVVATDTQLLLPTCNDQLVSQLDAARKHQLSRHGTVQLEIQSNLSLRLVGWAGLGWAGLDSQQ